MITIAFQKLSEIAKIPSQATHADAWYDLYATHDYCIHPWQRQLCPTNIAAVIPQGYYGRIAPRSWLAYKAGIDVLAWVIDSGYRGDIWVILINFGNEDFIVHTWDKIAQFIIEKCYEVVREEVKTLPESQRGEGWFGSTGQ